MKKYKAKFKLIKDSPFSFEYKPGVVKTKDKWEKLIHCHIEDWPDFFEEIKEPLFITEDGIEIFELNGNLYEVSLPSHSYSGCIDLKEYEIDEFENILERSLRNNRYFSTKEAAEKWIEENKPVYSKKQILDIIEKYNSIMVEVNSILSEHAEKVSKCIKLINAEVGKIDIQKGNLLKDKLVNIVIVDNCTKFGLKLGNIKAIYFGMFKLNSKKKPFNPFFS